MVKFRDFVNGRCLLKISNAGHTTSLVMTQDCKRLITVSMEGCIMIWKLPEELSLHCQKKMADLNIHSTPACTPLKKDIDKVINEWESVAGVSPIVAPAKHDLSKEAKEAEHAALGAAEFIKNLLSSKKESDTESSIAKTTRTEEVSCTNIVEEIEEDIPPEDPPMMESETNSIMDDESRSVSMYEEKHVKKPILVTTSHREEEKEISQSEDKEGNLAEEVAIEEETQEIDDADIFGELLMKQRNIEEERPEDGQIDLRNMPVRDSLTTKFMFNKDKARINDEFKEEYQKAHQNPAKRDKKNILFANVDFPEIQSKFPNQEKQSDFLKDLIGDHSKPSAPPQDKSVKPSISPEIASNPQITEKAAKKVTLVDEEVNTVKLPVVHKISQTEDQSICDQIREGLSRLEDQVKHQRVPNARKTLEALIPVWDSLLNSVGLGVDPLEKQTKELLDKYSELLLNRIDENMKKH